MDYEKKIEIPFGANDSELKGWEYTIPEGMEAVIENGKVIARQRESEDEKIRKLLVWQVHRNIEDETNDLAGSVYDGIKGHDPDLEESIEDWKKCLDWLEKQKEQKPNIELIQRSWYMEGYHDREFNMEPKWTVKAETGGPRYYENPNYGKPLEQKEQKPAEWSEEDEVYLQDALWCVKQASKVARGENDMGACWSAERWLKSLPGKFVLQPKQEWSEEDEKMRNKIIEHLSGYIYPNSLYGEDAKECIDWLKSLRPQPHTVSIKNATKFGNLEYERGVKDGIQSEKSRCWKPNEEQMEAFKKYIEEFQARAEAAVGGWNNLDIMIRLYEQLKKLM